MQIRKYDRITNDIFSGISESIPSLFSKNISILLDKSGAILDVGAKEDAYISAVFNQIQKTTNIQRLFDFPEEYSFKEIAERHIPVYGYDEKLDVGEKLDEFYTSLPVAALRLMAVADGQYLGVINFAMIFNSVFEKHSGCIIYLDQNEKLIGYNHSFYELFRESVASPRALLGRPAAGLMSDPPGKCQQQVLSGTGSLYHEGYRQVYTKDFTRHGLDKREHIVCMHHAVRQNKGLYWRSASHSAAFLTIRIPVQFHKEDVVVELEVGEQSAGLPLVIFGDEGRGLEQRDQQGYLMGLTPKQDGFHLKKCGFPLHFAPADPNPYPLSPIRMGKIGRTMLIESERERLFGFYDHEMLERMETYVTLYLRPESENILKRVSVLTRPSGIRPNEPVQLMTRAGKNRCFLLNRLNTYHLASFQGKYSAYRLQDITYFQDRLSGLEKQYRKQLREDERLRKDLEKMSRAKHLFIGSGKVTSAIREKAERLAGFSTAVLIQGETGSGKEVLAHYIHLKSAFSEGPFLKVDCSVLPKSLMESQLFGYEKGAFTGADKPHIGLFEQASGGTLFLDEIGNLSLDVQVKLLMFLNDYTITRIGGDNPVKLDIRLITASNASISEMVRKGTFREDLYYRIAVVPIEMAPLSSRLDDLPELCRYFLQTFAEANNRPVRSISAAAFKKLYEYRWPGNVRELRNVLERAIVFCDGSEIGSGHIMFESGRPEGSAGTEPFSGKRKKNTVNIGADELFELLRREGGVIKRAAASLNVSPRTLYYHFQKLGIRPNDLRAVPYTRKNQNPKA